VIEFERKKALLPILNQIASVEATISAEQTRQAKAAESANQHFLKLQQQDSARVEIQKAKSALNDIDAAKAQILGRPLQD